MGREVMRVPENFDWPINKIWPGRMFSLCSEMGNYNKNMNDEERCELCRKYATLSGYEIASHKCPILPFQDPPKGEWYQVWETTSEGSPISPSFSTPEELAYWLADNRASSFGDMTASYEQWLSFIYGPGWAPSMIMKGGILESGVTAI